ncbi:WD repeat-containing protein SRW1 [Colletotrichum tofieldiae]|nr:WD repeat-containing protein SRW1 [Colletotrichum tofieldiae]GKT71732.1 WD repeat-containing protein SRW1 [Colletotrichum tofieldiae]
MTLPVDSSAAVAASASTKRPVAETSDSAAATPARFATPPPPSDRGHLENRHNLENTNQRKIQHSRRPSEPARTNAFDADAVDSALLREMHHRSQRESTPGASPHRKRQRINGDRCVCSDAIRSKDPF